MNCINGRWAGRNLPAHRHAYELRGSAHNAASRSDGERRSSAMATLQTMSKAQLKHNPTVIFRF